MGIREKILQLEEEMNGKYIHRREEIRGLLVGLLTKSNVILLGQPGTSKTDMVQTLARAIKSDCFETILTRTSSPEELFGAYDIRELENGRYVRNTDNSLAKAHFGFVDEVFKCNSSVLNGLLGVMAQRTFRNGNSTPENIPLQLFVGASNEMPEGGATGELSALWDRFEIRYVVDYIKDDAGFAKLLQIGPSVEPKTMIDMEDLVGAQKEVSEVPLKDAEPIILNLWKLLKKEGFVVSDRKWRNLLKYLQAVAWLNGNKKVEIEDISFLKNVLWNEPEQYKTIKKIIGQFATPEMEKAQETLDSCLDIVAELFAMGDNDAENKSKFGTTKTIKATEVHAKLIRAGKLLQTTRTTRKSKGQPIAELDRIIKEIKDNTVKVANILLGN